MFTVLINFNGISDFLDLQHYGSHEILFSAMNCSNKCDIRPYKSNGVISNVTCCQLE